MNIHNAALEQHSPVAPQTVSSSDWSPQKMRTVSPPRDIAGPSEYDVMCGRGIHSQNNSGNRRFRAIIDENLEQYLEVRTKREKSLIVQSIIARIHRNKGRFVRKDRDTGEWHEIDTHEVKEKVGHALRDAKQKRNKRRAKKKRGEETTCFEELLKMQREIFRGFVRQDKESMEIIPEESMDFIPEIEVSAPQVTSH